MIVTGPSRIGKAVLIAGAFDERLAISAPAGNGGGGAGAYRLSGFGRGGGEGLDDMEQKCPNWFGPNLYPFAKYADKLPFDQHWFVVLTVPRGFIPSGSNTLEQLRGSLLFRTAVLVEIHPRYRELSNGARLR